MLLPQNGSLPHIAFALREHDLRNAAGETGAHSPLPVLLNGGVGPLVPMEDGKLTAHLLLERVQKRRLVVTAGIGGQLIGQHVCAADTFLLHHGHGEPVEHQHTQHHHQGDAHAQHRRNQIPHLAANTLHLLFIVSTVCNRRHIFLSLPINSMY